uniref:BPTI/Kunitz inhibitor domain-containing protein n=1 Tax=Laticauda laticaudata TaxID=8630 RepID=A0A8C5S9I1_LATLA
MLKYSPCPVLWSQKSIYIHVMIFQVSLRGTVCLIFLFTFSGETPEICNLPAKVGWCKASFHRFYFNPTTGNCEEFIYGGCGGNNNNFVQWFQYDQRHGEKTYEEKLQNLGLTSLKKRTRVDMVAAF